MLLYNILSVGILQLFWYITQRFLECDNDDQSGNKIIDRVHNLNIIKQMHNYLLNNINVTRYIIIFTTLMIDINVIYFVYEFVINDQVKPIMLLIMGIFFRQLCQCINRLPSPDGVIWFDPGFPSLIMHYDVTNDFFFSGHTLVSLIFGIELLGSPHLIIQLYAGFYMISEILFVLTSKAHYFMDIYGAVSTYFMLSYFYDKMMI